LLLARDQLPDPLEQALAGKEIQDGELTAEQVLRTWRLNADLVTLSACWSGLGGTVSGGGSLNFAHALILAGAKSVVLSLWNVDDAATALLMVRFYENLLGRRGKGKHPLPRAEALAEAKHWLRNLSAAEVDHLSARLPALDRLETVSGPPRSAAKVSRPYEHPHYWAAFILIGDSD
jgi:CHAT domain-containing protein